MKLLFGESINWKNHIFGVVMKADKEILAFCNLIRSRSEENRRAIDILSKSQNAIISPSFSILRQELDSMIRVIYLLNIETFSERKRIINQTLNGEQWTVKTENGKERKVTDREMVNLVTRLYGWTLSVYKFGCSFIHLSNFHNHLCENPVSKLSVEEKKAILNHMKEYHGYYSDSLEVQDIWPYIPQIFDKISGNLGCYVEDLQNNSTSSL